MVSYWVQEQKAALRPIDQRDGLASAAKGNRIEVFRYLLPTAGAQITARVVRKACNHRSLELFELLLQHGYHLDHSVPSNHGHFGTALCHFLDSEIFTGLLLGHGAD